MVHLHSSLLFVPDVSFNTFSSFRSTPNNYLFSTERWFTASACSATVIDLLSSFIQHSLLLQISNDSRHTLSFAKNKCAKLGIAKTGFSNPQKAEENKKLKTTLEETSPLYELLKNKFGDQFEEWKNNLFKSFRSKINLNS